MKGVCLDRVDFPARSPALHQEEGCSQRKTPERQHDQHAGRLDALLGRKAFIQSQTKKQTMQKADGAAHRCDQNARQEPDHGGDHDQAGFARPDESPEPVRDRQHAWRR